MQSSTIQPKLILNHYTQDYPRHPSRLGFEYSTHRPNNGTLTTWSLLKFCTYLVKGMHMSRVKVNYKLNLNPKQNTKKSEMGKFNRKIKISKKQIGLFFPSLFYQKLTQLLLSFVHFSLFYLNQVSATATSWVLTVPTAIRCPSNVPANQESVVCDVTVASPVTGVYIRFLTATAVVLVSVFYRI